MRIFKATHLGMCFGVRNAITLANKVAVTNSPFSANLSIIILSLMSCVMRSLGESFQEIRYDTVMITAHGCSQKTIASLQARGYQVLQSTCPLVRYVHKTVRHREMRTDFIQ